MADTSFLDQLLATQIYVRDASGNPVNIGYFTGNNNPCGGNIYVYADYADEYNHGFYPPSEWWYKDITTLGVLTPFTQYCVNKGIQPSWSVTASNGAVTAASPVGPFSVNPQVSPAAPNNPQTLVTSIETAASGVASGAAAAVSGLVPNLTTGTGGLLLFGGGALMLVLLMGRRR